MCLRSVGEMLLVLLLFIASSKHTSSVVASTSNVSVVGFHVNGFDYDTTKHTIEKIELWLNAAEKVANQTQLAYRLDGYGLTTYEMTRKLLFTQMIAQASTTRIGANIVLQTNGETNKSVMIGYTRSSYSNSANSMPWQSLLMFNSTFGACGNTDANVADLSCCSIMFIDAHGNPTTIQSQYTIPTPSIFSNEVAIAIINGVWLPTTNTQLDAGAMFTKPLFNESGMLVGQSLVVMFADIIDSFLSSNFGNTDANESERQVVFIVDSLSRNIMGASVSGVSTVRDAHGLLVPVGIADCSNAMIKQAGYIALAVSDSDLNDENMLISSGQMVQQSLITRPGLHWHVISARQGKPSQDYPTTNSESFTAVVAASTFLASCMVALSFFILKFRNRVRLWKYAQPTWLLAMLFANATCLVYACALMTTPTHTNCVLQLWTRTMGLTLVGASILVKVEVMAHAAVTHDLNLSYRVKMEMNVIKVLAISQVVMLALHSVSSMHVFSILVNSNGNLVKRMACQHDMKGLGGAINVVIGLINAVALWRAYSKRNMVTLCEENRGLFTAAVQAAVMSSILIAVDWTDPTRVLKSQSSLSLVWFQVLLVWWYVATMVLFVFSPRIYRHMKRGDLTVKELQESVLHKLKGSGRSGIPGI